MADKTAADTTDAAGDFIAPTTWNSTDALRLDGDAVDKLAELGARASGVTAASIDLVPAPGLPDRIPVAFIHGDKPEVMSLKALAEQWRTRPDRREGTAKVGDVASLCALTNRQKTEHSVVFANSDWKHPSLQTIIDYHASTPEGDADNGRHRIRYDFPFSDEWQVWTGHDGKAMDQAEFAEFMEERAPDMTTLVEAEAAHFARELQLPAIGTPAQIFALARGLQINVESKVKQDIRLQSGETKLVFEEQHSGSDGQPISVPGAFALSIPLFYGQEPIAVPVRLRYRVRNGAIHWTYRLFRVDRLVAEAVDHAKTEVAAVTGLPVYEGTPEMDNRARIG
ncbi:hypothetical protein [Aurantimonas phage AmM-1]|uniref:hypothetical protein n=1 Tax=Aurantimonas phage AmM-1 TaxID=1503929 RepID=UPI000540E79E|nr:hypothetical protein ACQ23_gp51 [Aurantimonas phage AmM-1]BAP94508.1 hypothetical protein [Aurantimonas phage AmM-1]